jgi:transposase
LVLEHEGSNVDVGFKDGLDAQKTNQPKGAFMIYVGMDVSSKSFVVHAVNERKKVVMSKEIPPTREGLRKMAEGLGKERKLVVFEAGNQMKWIAETLKKMEGVEVHVVHPNEVKWINQSSGKTDKIDARKLAELARGDLLPRKVHVVEGSIRELREMVSARDQLLRKRVALINTLRGYVKQEGQKLPAKFFQGELWKDRLKKLPLSKSLKLIIESFQQSIEALRDSEIEITQRILEIEDERIELLESIPGIGKLTSRVLVGAIDDVKRFDGKKALAKYGALTPRIYQSGDVTQLGRINRDGRREVRGMLLQCAHAVGRMKTAGSKPLREFYTKIERRRGKKIAVVALARKLLTTSYGVLRSGRMYDPAKLAA